jgi:DNA replication protein DnaC
MTDSEPLVLRILQALENHMNVLLYGPPGTGKSYLMSRVRE